MTDDKPCMIFSVGVQGVRTHADFSKPLSYRNRVAPRSRDQFPVKRKRHAKAGASAMSDKRCKKNVLFTTNNSKLKQNGKRRTKR